MTAEGVIQIILLALICLAAWLIVWHRVPAAEVGMPSDTAAPIASPPGRSAGEQAQAGMGPVCQVMLFRDGEWVPAQYVRKGSSAWQAAYDTPSQALRLPDGTLELGKQ